MQPKRVDFYILNSIDPVVRLGFVCKLIEKIYARQHQLFVYCQTEQQAHELDEALWTFKPESFIPHHLQHEGPTPPPPIQIGLDNPSKQFKDLLLNETPSFPLFSDQFKRIIEIIDDNILSKTAGREKYRTYQSHGYSLFTHQIDTLKEVTREPT